MTARIYIPIPFASSGNTAVIPETVQSDGSISFPAGYGPDYALNPEVDPDAILVDRQTFNYLMYVVTLGLSWLQSDFPQWISTSDNLGTAFSYNINAVVRYTDGNLYQSTANNNTSQPTTGGAQWVLFGSLWATTAALAAEVARAEAAEAALAPINSPNFTGSPQAPTQSPGTLGQLLATCSFVASAVAAETARAEAAEALLASKLSPAFAGTPTAPTAGPLTSNGQLATTAYTDAAVAVETGRAQTAEASLAHINSPAFTGTPTAPTPAPGDNTTKLATTAFVQNAMPSFIAVRYARIYVPIGGAFAISPFSWNAPFPTGCLACVASCEANDSFSVNADGNNFVAITTGPGQAINTLPNATGGYVRVDTDEGKQVFGGVVVNIIGVGN